MRLSCRFPAMKDTFPVLSRGVQELGGWASLSLVQRYAHVSPVQEGGGGRRAREKFYYAIYYARNAAIGNRLKLRPGGVTERPNVPVLKTSRSGVTEPDENA